MKKPVFLLVAVFAFAVFGFSPPGRSGYPGLESKDPERYYQRLKDLRTKRPNDPENTYRIANVYYSLQMEDEAIKEYRRVLKLDPNHDNAKWFLSHLLYSKGYYDEAFRLTESLITKTPLDADLYYWAGEILEKLEQYDTAKQYFTRCDELKFPEREGYSPPARRSLTHLTFERL
jgi:tetratricopeptide (TPR) repeat protein